MKQLALFLLVTSIGYSQTISKQIIGAAGKTQSNSNLILTWTTGEPVVGLMTAGGNQLGNGYYPSMDLQALSVEDNTLEAQIIVYPNPTSQMLYVSHPELNSFGIQIVDLNGKQVYYGIISKDDPLDVSNYSQGMYLITIENKEANKKNTYKIIKN
ncbi:T9SS type A sorting domain-containing protein [Flavobacterium sp.]|uniref:T9SS type A sorting domain-containing protein n=1 Tax=Flavobacterium sp. TaxID=239 RepID=UPI003BBDFF4B